LSPIVSVSPWQQPSRPHRHVVVAVGMALLAVSAVAVVALLAVSAVVGLLAVSAGEGLLVVVDFVGVGARVGAGGAPASMAPIAGGVRVAAVGSAHTIDRPDRIATKSGVKTASIATSGHQHAGVSAAGSESPLASPRAAARGGGPITPARACLATASQKSPLDCA